MDVNQTRYHALLGRQDWGECFDAEADGNLRRLREAWQETPPARSQFYWDEARSELTLRPKQHAYPPPKNARPPSEQDRRGAARDRYGNWYWIDENKNGIMIRSVGSQQVTVWWSSARPVDQADPFRAGRFAGVDEKPVAPLQLEGLTITDEHFLVVGVVSPPGFIVFDLHAGGPPVQYCWPQAIPFTPYDLAATRGGGFWVLDQTNKRLWALDRRLDVVRKPGSVSEGTTRRGDFSPAEPGENSSKQTAEPVHMKPVFGLQDAVPVHAVDPVAIAALEDDTVLVLDRKPAGEPSFSSLQRYRMEGELGTVSLSGMKALMEEQAATTFTLLGYDLAVLPLASASAQERKAQVLVVEEKGNQSYAFELTYTATTILIAPQVVYFPMRLFSGKGLVAAGGKAYYDSGSRWLVLTDQRRPRYVEQGVLVTPDGREHSARDSERPDRQPFDGKEPGCVWHRVFIDARIPPEGSIEVWSRAADRTTDLRRAPWQKEPPLYRRGDGSELPFVPASTDKHGGTWETLLQKARGRYLQLKLVVTGNGRVTPHLRALRVYYPRFSYLERYLPAVYREDWESAHFLEGFLANVEGFYTAIEDRIAAVQVMFDRESVPDEYVEWLAGWYGLVFDARLKLGRQAKRLLTKYAMDFFRARGTMRGIQMALAVVMDECLDEAVFTRIPQACGNVDGARIVERFQTRKIPPVVLGDPSELMGIRRTSRTGAWTPREGASSLHDRYRRFLGLPAGAGTVFPIVDPGGAQSQAWQDFSQATLGFVPSGAADEVDLWRRFLRGRHGELARLNEAYGTAYQSFAEIPLPSGTGEAGAPHRDWIEFLQGTAALSQSETRGLWQAFLRRRYQRIEAANSAHRTAWTHFGAVAYPSELPQDGPLLGDWFQFEAVVLSMQRTAHRFTVVLPVPPQAQADPEDLRRRRDLAERIIAVEKPAHTMGNVKFFWSMFRLGEARLGCDTVLDVGSRAPEFMAPFVLGERGLLEGYLAPTPQERIRERRVIGDWYA